MSIYDEQIEELKTRADERGSLRYPEAFREDAVEFLDTLRDKDWTQKRISESLEIPWATLARWCDQANGEDEERPEGFRPVELVGQLQNRTASVVQFDDLLTKFLPIRRISCRHLFLRVGQPNVQVSTEAGEAQFEDLSSAGRTSTGPAANPVRKSPR